MTLRCLVERLPDPVIESPCLARELVISIKLDRCVQKEDVLSALFMARMKVLLLGALVNALNTLMIKSMALIIHAGWVEASETYFLIIVGGWGRPEVEQDLMRVLTVAWRGLTF